jgi:hypothetical protein
VSLRLGQRDERADRRRRDDLVHLLVRRKLKLADARRIVNRATLTGSFDGARDDMTRNLRSTWATRTFYDLYNAIGLEARQLSIGSQEQLEQAAYAMLSGRVVIE